MNLLDYIIIILMVFLIIRGVMRGFIREIFSLAGIVLGIWLAVLFQPQATEFIRPYLPDGKYLPLLSVVGLFAVIFITFNIAGWAVGLLFKKAFLGWFDRILGACFAVVKGIVIIYVAMVFLTFFVPEKTPLIAGSRLTPLIIRSYQSMVHLISPDYYRNLQKKILGGEEKTAGATTKKEENGAGKSE